MEKTKCEVRIEKGERGIIYVLLYLESITTS